MNKKSFNIKIINNILNNYIFEYTYNYGNLKNINVKIYDSGFIIEYIIKNKSEYNDYFDKQNIKEIIKKAQLIYVLKNLHYSDENNLSLYVDNILIIKKENYIYSLLNSSSYIPKINYDSIIADIVNLNRGKYSLKIVALQNLILGINTPILYFKFSFLWTAFNSLYNQFNKDTDAKGLNDILNKYANYTDEISRRERDFIFKNFYMSFNEEKDCKYINKKLREKNKSLITNYNIFMMTHYSYYLRCKYFHGKKSIPLIAMENDKELKSLQFCTNLLKDFLIEHLNDNLANWGE